MAEQAVPATPVRMFERQATGLVRAAGTLDVLIYNINFVSIGLMAVLVFLFSTAFYPGANLYVMTLLIFACVIPTSLVFAFFAAAMPRSGGDYVYVSRTLHPALGMMSEIIATFCRRKVVGYVEMILSMTATAFIGFGVWVHHMFSTGLPNATLLYFAAASLVIVIPSGIQIFAWCMTLVTGRPEFRTPLLYIVGFIVFFVFGGLSGITFAAIPVDQQLTDTY